MNYSAHQINITTRFKNTENELIALHDIAGRQIFRKRISTNTQELSINMANLHTGIYTLYIDSGNKRGVRKVFWR